MAKIGNLGKLIVFEVSDDKVLTFQNMSQSVKGRWATHEVISGKPKSEFLGAGLRSVSLSVFLSATHGAKPRKTIEKIERAVEQGTPYPLVIGGKRIGSNQWVITDMSETWETVIQGGKLMEASISITLSEYV